MYLVYALLLVYPAKAFNLDPRFSLVFGDPSSKTNSSFGYSVVFWEGSFKGSARKWVLVGAPKGKNSKYNAQQFGSVYKCDLDGENKEKTRGMNGMEWMCEPFDDLTPVLDVVRNTAPNNNYDKYCTDGAMFGATLVAETKPDGAVVTCAPNIRQVRANFDKTAGVCVMWRGEKSTILPPGLAEGSRDESDYALDNGFSVHFIKDSSSSEIQDLFVGAPGKKYFKGRADLYNLNRNKRAKTLEVSRHVPLAAPRGFFFGYALASGRFNRNGDTSLLVSAPRVSNDKKVTIGAVLVSDRSKPENYRYVYGEQLGEYFGYSLVTLDLDGDGWDDLLVVGAPFHRGTAADQGRVYTFVPAQNTFRLADPTRVLMGSAVRGAQFGASLAAIGDLNQDGFNDLAVGAPFEGKGAVYIYHGTTNGVKSEFGQRIRASDFRHDLAGFGFSLAPAADIDGNGVNELIVGAVFGDKVAVIKAYPVLVLSASLSSSDMKLNTNATGFAVQASLRYTSKTTLRVGRVGVSVKFEADVKLKRVGLTVATPDCDPNNCTVAVDRDQDTHLNLTVHIKGNLTQFSKPITIRMVYELTHNPLQHNSPHFCKDCPVADPKGPSSESITVPFRHGCESEDVCRSDLSVHATFLSPEMVILGRSEVLKLEVTVSNSGDPAYSADLFLATPQERMYRFMPPGCHDSPVHASALACRVGNPLNSHVAGSDDKHQERIVFDLDLTQLTVDQTWLVFNMTVNSTSDEVRPSDNNYQSRIRVRLEADLLIGGLKKGLRKTNEEKETEIVLNHVYEVSNAGPSPALNTTAEFLIPVYVTIDGVRNRLVSSVSLNAFHDSRDKSFYECSIIDKEMFGLDDLTLNNQTSVWSDEHLGNKLSRNKRSVDDTSTMDVTSEAGSNVTSVNCSRDDVACVRAVCRLGTLRPNTEGVRVNVHFKVNASVLKMLTEGGKTIHLATQGAVSIAGNEAYVNSSKSSDTAINYTELVEGIRETHTPLWVYIAGGVLGLALLAGSLLLLKKAGFFKRKQKERLQSMRQTVSSEGTPGPSTST